MYIVFVREYAWNLTPHYLRHYKVYTISQGGVLTRLHNNGSLVGLSLESVVDHNLGP